MPAVQCEHGVVVSALKPCLECRKKPAAAPTATATDVDEFEHELEVRQAEYRADGKWMRRHARELIEGPDSPAQDRRDAYKAIDVAIKLERLALETLKEIRDKRHDRWLAAEVARQQGREAGN